MSKVLDYLINGELLRIQQKHRLYDSFFTLRHGKLRRSFKMAVGQTSLCWDLHTHFWMVKIDQQPRDVFTMCIPVSADF